MIKYLITSLILLTSCEASLTFRVMPGPEILPLIEQKESNSEPIHYDELTESLGIEEPFSCGVFDRCADRFLVMANPKKYSKSTNAGWFCDSCGKYNYAHNKYCADCGNHK